MKKFIYTVCVAVFCLIVSNASAQVLKYANLQQIRHKEKAIGFMSYVSKDGTIYKIGDRLRVLPDPDRWVYKGIEANKFAGQTYAREKLSDLIVVSIETHVDQMVHSADACTHTASLVSKDVVTDKIYRVLIDIAIEKKEVALISTSDLTALNNDRAFVPTPTAPAKLQIQNVSFSEKNGNGNNILDANESAEITFTLANSGKGDAYDVAAQLKPVNAVNGLAYPTMSQIGVVTAAGNKTVTIPISASVGAESGTSEFEIIAKEGNGFDSEPVRISFVVQKFRNPVVAIADHKFSAEDNKVRLTEPITLEIILQNRGQGEALDVNVNFKNPQNVFPGSETSFNFKSLKANETKTVLYDFFANKLYTAKEIPIEVSVTERHGKFGAKEIFKVSVGENLAQTQVVKIAGQTEKDVKIDDVSLRPVVETKNEPTLKAELEKSSSGSGIPSFYSLFIGIDRYQYASGNLPHLNKPVSDASLLRNTLLTSYAFPADRSVFLKNPTRADIIKALEELGNKVTTKDNLLIFYAGHGYWDDRLKIGYWLPSDSKPLDENDKSNWISNSTVRDYIAGIQSKHTLLITDACFGGGIFKTRDVSSTELSAGAMSMLYRMSSRKAMTSGTLTTVPDESQFMKFLVRRLADNTSEYMTARQLFYSIETAVLNNTSTVPQLGVIQDTGDEGGDFIFIRSKK